MKFIASICCAVLLCISTNAQAQIPENLPEVDKQAIDILLQDFADAIATGNATEMLKLLSPDVPDALRQAIQNNIDQKPIQFSATINEITYDETSQTVTLTGPFDAAYDGAVTWSLTGVPHTVILQKQGENWYITHTDAIEKFSAKTVLRIVLPFLLLLLAVWIFWLWMFIDACLHSFNNNKNRKVRWLVCFFVFNIFTAIVYFFTVHKTPKNSAPAAIRS